MDGDDAVQHGLLDTSNEHLFVSGMYLHHNPALNQYRVRIGDIPVARIVAAATQPSSDAFPERVIVDHANGDSMDNRASNLHWVTPSFNTFNNTKRFAPTSGYFGVLELKNKTFQAQFAGKQQGVYERAETAALVYNLVVRLHYTDMLNKTPHLLNKVGPDSRTERVSSQSDSVSVYRIDNLYVVIFECKVWSRFTRLQDARAAAERLVIDTQRQRERNEAAWKRKEETLRIEDKDREEGIACIPAGTESSKAKILLSDESWKKIKARDASMHIIFGRACIRFDCKILSLPRWLLNAKPADIVDHVNGNVFDNRLDNIRITDRAGNGQNIRQAEGAGWKGVRFVRGGWRVTTKVRGQPRAANRGFDISELNKALELYDLAALHQHQAGAYLNVPKKRDSYMQMLGKPATRAYVEDFLAGKRVGSSPYKGVSATSGKPGTFQSVVKGRGTKKLNGKGAEVRLAIFYDLNRLKHTGADMTVNFEWMRPWYLFHIDRLGPHNEDALAEQALKLLGGDEFIDTEQTRFGDGVVDLAAPTATSSSSRKRKALA